MRKDAGQAMVEFLVGLVALLALTVGLLQFVSLNTRHAEALEKARLDAGVTAMLDLSDDGQILSNPDCILDWREGPDGERHTRDDRADPANPLPFTERIAGKAAGSPAEWSILGSVPDTRLPDLRDNPDPVSAFGLVRGHRTATVPLLPGVQDLLYRAKSVDVEGEAWMTWTKGIY
jgi:hypothetical protein